MKLIIAIIQPTKLESVKAALTEVEVFRLTVMDVQGLGRQKGHAELYRGHEISVNLLRKVQLQIAVNEEFVEPTINAIIKGGRTGPSGEIGDGKIFVIPLDDCIRIRTGERGGDAIWPCFEIQPQSNGVVAQPFLRIAVTCVGKAAFLVHCAQPSDTP